MRPDLKVISAAIEEKEFEELEKVRLDIGISRSDLIREALRQFLAVYKFNRYIDHLRPDQIRDITEYAELFKGTEYKMTCEKRAAPTNCNQKSSSASKSEDVL